MKQPENYSMFLINKIQYVIFTVLLILVSNLYSQESPGLVSRLKYDIGVLAHDSMFGREAGTRAERRSAEFISLAFHEAGLASVYKANDSYLSPFFIGNVRYEKVNLTIKGTGFKMGLNVGALPVSASGIIEDAKIMAIGSEDGSDWKNSSATGSAIGIIDLERFHLGIKKEKELLLNLISEAEIYEIKGAILFNAQKDDFEHRLFNPDSLPELPIPVIYATEEVMKAIRKDPSARCDLEVRIDKQRSKAYNVIGFLDNKAEYTVVIGGHYDHVGTSTKGTPVIGDPNIHNGADDNASGTAAVMELARWAVKQSGLKYNYLFIAFTAEEKGLWGSYNFCNREEFRDYKIAWMLNLDMIGRLGWKGEGKDRLTAQGLKSSPVWRQVLRDVDHGSMHLVKINGGPGYSDHYPFLQKGIPVLYFTTGLEKEYHSPADDPELINYKGEAQIVEYLEKIILNMESRPVPKFHKVRWWHHTSAFFREFIFR